VRWARDNARRFGGDPDRIVLVGHSAGAYNAAMVALDPRWLRAAGVPAGAIKGWAGLAGPYDFCRWTTTRPSAPSARSRTCRRRSRSTT
jgi:acetyl esterase/lipase